MFCKILGDAFVYGNILARGVNLYYFVVKIIDLGLGLIFPFLVFFTKESAASCIIAELKRFYRIECVS